MKKLAYSHLSFKCFVKQLLILFFFLLETKSEKFYFRVVTVLTDNDKSKDRTRRSICLIQKFSVMEARRGVPKFRKQKHYILRKKGIREFPVYIATVGIFYKKRRGQPIISSFNPGD